MDRGIGPTPGSPATLAPRATSGRTETRHRLRPRKPKTELLTLISTRHGFRLEANMTLTPGRAYHLQCLGPVPGPKWLDGRTGNGTVGLAPETDGGFTGTKWRVFDGGGAVVLQCLGTVPGWRYLDGRTANGSVGLAPNTAGSYTGTRWKVSDGGAEPFGSNVKARSQDQDG
jgi:hypothetical protein